MSALNPKPMTKILVVDDEMPVVNYIVRTLLTLEPQPEIEIAVTGTEACRKINEFQPDLVTLDLNIPEIDGFKICQEIKSNPVTKSIPVLVISGENQPQLKNRLLSSSVDKFLAKPFTMEELIQTVKELLPDKGKTEITEK